MADLARFLPWRKRGSAERRHNRSNSIVAVPEGVEDLHYRPPDDGVDWLRTFTPHSCLLYGKLSQERLDQLSVLGAEIRTSPTDMWERVLRRGAYAMRIDDRWVALVADVGQEPDKRLAVRERFAEGHLGAVVPIFKTLWPSAHAQSGASPFAVNDVVCPRGERKLGRVRKIVLRQTGYEIHVDIDGVIRQFGESALERVDGDPLDPDFWTANRPVGAEDLALTLTWTKMRHPLTDTLYSYAASKTIFRPYQFVPVLKLLTSSSGRLLIADEVGLGKTIEAGLIWSELEQRTPLDRVLVVVPASLVLKWKAEMQRRFDRPLDVLSPSDLGEFARQLRDGQEPRIHGVISMQAMRGAKEVLENLNELNPQFDLVIVDEAHAMRNRGTSTHLLGQMLSDWADYLIFLSATPLNLGQDDLFNLVNLLNEDEFGDKAVFASQLEPNQALTAVARGLIGRDANEPRRLVRTLATIGAMQLGGAVTGRPDFQVLRMLLDRSSPLTPSDSAKAKRLIADLNTLSGVFTRTRKVDVPDAKAVREPVQVDVQWTDQEYAFYQGVQRLYMQRAMRSAVPPGFAMQMPLRQAASCIPAMQRLIRERNPGLFNAEVDDFDDDASTLAEADIEELLRLDRPLERDSKFEALMQRLLVARRQGMRQAMVFSFFRRTLTYLAERLESQFSVRVMTGATNMVDRQVIMEDFRAGRFELLLLSEVGSEGLDFEFCNVLVNYDLPWNPMRVEQRIGRLDRFGQEHEKIFIFNMHVPGTIESDIFERLYNRIGVFTRSIGELEPILRDEFSDLSRELLDPRLTPEQRRTKADTMAVAIEARAQEIERLGESHGLLSSIDQLRIDGMTDEGPSEGRFVGSSEIRRLLDRLFARLGGKLSTPDGTGVCKLVGTDQLAQRLLRGGGIPARGSMYAVPKLAALLRDQEVIRVTFDTDVASKHNVELLSSRHPLVALALEEFEREPLSLRRFGAVAVPGLPAGRRSLARVDLAQSSGIRPLLEMWVTAVDFATGEPCPDVGPALLSALADGSIRDLAQTDLDVPPARLEQLADLAFARRSDVEAERALDNQALVEARIESRRRSTQLKIDRVERTLQEMRRDGGDPSIIRLHEGRLRNLLQASQAIADEMEPRKALTLSLTPIAVAIVEGV